MGISPQYIRLLGAGMALSAMASPAYALFNLNDGRTRIFVTSSVSATYDSNLYASSGGNGDMVYAWDLSTELTRNAGLIGINASVGFNASDFGKYTEENFRNPRIQAEFTKKTGRLTGGLSLGLARQNRADAAANLREASWSYDAALNLNYPVLAGRYSVSGNFTYNWNDYIDNSVVVDVRSFGAGSDLNYILGDTRTLFAGYHFKRDTTSAAEKNLDHAVTVGFTDRLFARINTTFRAGYVFRKSEGLTKDRFNSWTSVVAANWNPSRRLTFGSQVTKDFSTTSTNVSANTLAAGLNAGFDASAMLSFSAGLNWSTSSFLGDAGAGRKDSSLSWNAGVSQLLFNRLLRVSLSVQEMYNWSTESVADFTRQTVNLTASVTQL